MGIFGSLGKILKGAGATAMQASGIMPGEDGPITGMRQPFPGMGAPQSEWGMGKRLLGGLLDGIMTTTGGQPMNIPMMLAQKQRGMSLQDEQRKREQDLQDAIELARAKAEFREPTALQQNFSWFKGLPAEEQQTFQRYQDMTRPLIPLDMQTEAGGPVMRSYVPQSQAPGAGIPNGSPTQGAPNSKVIQGPKGPMQVWLVNGEWYDNPEGR